MMSKNQFRFLAEILPLFPLSIILVLIGGVEMGISFRVFFISAGLNFTTAKLGFAIALPVGLVLNGFLMFRVHRLISE